MNAIQNFAFEEHLVRVAHIDEEPWFIGKDICAVLKISKHRDALATLDDDETRPVIVDGNAGKREMTSVSEPGVYRLVFRSRKQEAERFKRWLAHEVLPQIRKTGKYAEKKETEPAPFEFGSASLGEAQLRLAAVREARLLYGPEKARALWDHLELPEIRHPMVTYGGPYDAMTCLHSILHHDLEGNPDLAIYHLITTALEGDKNAKKLLMQHGVRVERNENGREGFFIANRHPYIHTMLENNHPEIMMFTWRYILSRLRGTTSPKHSKRYGDVVCRSIFIPVQYLDLGRDSVLVDDFANNLRSQPITE